MKYLFEIEKIVLYLKKYKGYLSDLYTWSAVSEKNWNANVEKLFVLNLISENEISRLNNNSPLEKEILLKEILCEKLNDKHKVDKEGFNNLCLWIIKDWGGIKGPKDSSTIEVVHEFLELKKPKFNRIASCSKVGAFMCPDKYIIYDSRVAYALNWIILSENAGKYFFPIPSGRNSKMSAFDMNVLIRLMNVEKYEADSVNNLNNKLFISNRDKSLYIKKSEAYVELNKLIKEVNNRLWEEEAREKMLFYTEMLLFSIADKYIYQDITKKVVLSIN